MNGELMCIYFHTTEQPGYNANSSNTVLLLPKYNRTSTETTTSSSSDPTTSSNWNNPIEVNQKDERDVYFS